MKKLMMILCTILCANILAAQIQFTSGGLKYELIVFNNSVEVAQQNSSDISGSVIIPSTVTYNGTTYSVTSIGGSAFLYCSGLTSVTIPNSVTSIGERAFLYCSSLTSINVASGNTHYSSIDGVLYNYVQDTLIQCPGAKTSVTIPNSVTSIGGYAFGGCSGLTSVTIPNSVTSIGDGAFSSCSGLTSINVASGNTHYSSIDGVLYNYVQDTLIQCPGAKTSVSIPNSVTSIGNSAFWGCRGLTSVTIPKSVTSIGYLAFLGCSGLTTLNFNAIDCQDFFDEYYYDNGNRYYPFSGTSLTTVNIGDSVQRIPGNFVRDCSSLTSVTIGTGVTLIGDEAFSGCSGLTTLNFNAINCQYFWSDYSCGTSLTTVNIGDSVQRIPGNFVRGCSGLTSVTIPNSVTSIGRLAFSGCSGLTTLNFNAINCQDFDYAYAPFGGTSLTTVNIGDSVQRIPANFVGNCSGLTSVTIPNSVTSIGDYAFYGCSGLTSVTIPNSVTSIGRLAFRGCSGLTSVTIPNSVTSIGGGAFAYCSSLTSVTIPNSVTSIGNSAFFGCSSLTSVSIPSNITSIKNGTFYGCSGLTSITIPNSVTSIGDTAFKNCSGLTSVTIPNSVTSIGGGAFYNCSGLVSVVIGDGITNIGRNLFGDCPYLTYLTIGRSVESIENGAFLNCSLLSQITSWASVPPEIGGIDAFPHPNNCTVTVPCGSLGAYTEQTNRWNLLFNGRISEGLSFGLSVSANDEAYGRVEVENHSCESKTLTAIANEGYEFTAWNDGNTENPRTVTVTSDTAFMAIFTEAVSTPTITVTVNDATMGSASYTIEGNTAVLTATPNEGYEFTAWNDGNTENPRTVSLTSDTAFMAIFAEAVSTPTITLTVNNEAMGSASYTMDGNTAVLTATANEGYEFTGWNDGNTENPRTVTITSDTAFMAIFTEAVSTPTITVTVNDATMGSATYTLDGNTAVLTATANEGYSFLTWSDGNTENPRTVSLTSDTAFMAIFTASGSSSLQAVNAREFALYPNPAKSFVTLEFETLQENTLLQILDINGRRVRTFDLKAGIETLQIDVSDLSKGVYTVMLGNVTKKLIVE